MANLKKQKYLLATTAMVLGFTVWIVNSRQTVLSPSVRVASKQPTVTFADKLPYLEKSDFGKAHETPKPEPQNRRPNGANPGIPDLHQQFREPARRAALYRQTLARIEQSHGRLFQKLAMLPREKIAALKSLMAEGELYSGEFSIPEKPDEDAAVLAQRLAIGRDYAGQTDARIADLLGPESYAIYFRDQQSSAYRGTVEQLTNIMRSRGTPVDDPQQEAILQAYTNATLASTKLAASDSNAAVSAAGLQSIQQLQTERLDTNMMAALSQVLPPDALQSFFEAQFTQEDTRP